MQFVKIRYKSTNCYFSDTGNGLLVFDAGWPNTYREYKDGLKEQGYQVKAIRWLIVSHFHIDHAGLAGWLAENGVQFIVFKNQIDAIDEMESLIARKNLAYQKLDRAKIIVMEIAESREWLKSIGISGQVLRTNGHGEQSISLLLDDGVAFIGDLAPGNMLADDDVKSKNSWRLLKRHGAKRILPARAEEFMLG